MELRFNFLLVALLLLSVSADAGYHLRKDYTKTIKKQFNINPNGRASIDNQMGNIRIETWEQNAVRVSITIKVNARNEERAQTIMDRVDFSFDNTRDYVNVSTEIEGNSWSWKKGGDKHETFQVNYLITAPKSLVFNLENRYGSITTPHLDGPLTVSNAYGDVRLGDVKTDLNLELNYGNGQGGSATRVRGELHYFKYGMQRAEEVSIENRYGTLRANEIGKLTTDSRYGHYELGNVSTLIYSGRYDRFDIDRVDRVTFDGQFSNLECRQVRDELNLNMEYGSARVDQLQRGFSAVNIAGNYADCQIIVEDGASFQLDAEAEFAGVRYPRNMEVTREVEKGTSHHVKAYNGTPNARSVIRVRLDYGGLRLTE